MLTAQLAQELGFKAIPHYTIARLMEYDLGRNRYLSLGSVGTPNEMLFITERNGTNVTDIICLHNYDYDGYLTQDKLHRIISALI